MLMRRILVPLVGIEAERKALTLALRAAKAVGAHVDALLVLPDPNEALPYLGEGLTGGMIEEILESARTRGQACAELGRQMFKETAAAAGAKVVNAPEAGGGLTARYVEFTGPLCDVVAQAACVADLVVASDALIEPSVFEAALIDAGRPVLIAPKDELPATFATKVFLAWRTTREAGHAASAALPFLKAAKQVRIASVEREGEDPESEIAALKDYLALHGVRPTSEVFATAGKPLASILVEALAKDGSDLLVMGGYGHSRLREFILGGVTREIAAAAPIPILMAH